MIENSEKGEKNCERLFTFLFWRSCGEDRRPLSCFHIGKFTLKASFFKFIWTVSFFLVPWWSYGFPSQLLCTSKSQVGPSETVERAHAHVRAHGSGWSRVRARSFLRRQKHQKERAQFPRLTWPCFSALGIGKMALLGLLGCQIAWIRKLRSQNGKQMKMNVLHVNCANKG